MSPAKKAGGKRAAKKARVANALTPFEIAPYNPLDRKNLGASVADAMLARPVHPLADLPSFNGAGIYAIYYTGSFMPYSKLVERNPEGRFEAPIYVGRAVPKGARKGNVGLDNTPGRVLVSRLRQHARSIRDAKNLDVEDFYCRFLVVDDIWIPLGESLLIARFVPVWNQVLDGFGNHTPGKGRFEGLRPRWDVLHPGRAWAAKCAERSETADQIAVEVIQALINAPVISGTTVLDDMGQPPEPVPLPPDDEDDDER